MPKRTDISSVLVIGSGPIVIGQACEFDYSGTQAVKALKEEGYRVILINSNPATIMTDQNLADRTYIEPITAEFITRIIKKEKPDVVLPTIGGQTALNVTIELGDAGIFEKFGVEVIGAKVEAIKRAEDRDKFKKVVAACGLESARSFLVHSLEEAKARALEISFPFIIRPSRTLGGSGGGIVYNKGELEEKLLLGLEMSPNHELLLEESLIGWKEIELEVMRDKAGNGVIVCSIENLDPMGVHTGDSVTVAPVQTLTDKEYQRLRNGALKLINAIGVETGGSNVQFAIHPQTGRQIVIELNPRVSRSSALASKATGFPIAKIATKLAIGYTLDELPNDITKQTPACFEPSIDYVVVKIPRFTFEKFSGVDETLGTQMKSVGEAMAMGRTFPEALQKACRSLETGRTGLLGGPESKEENISVLFEKLKSPTASRLFQVGRALELGASTEEIFTATGIDPWFTNEMQKIIAGEKKLRNTKNLNITRELFIEAKQLGTSDVRLGQCLGLKEEEVRQLRKDFRLHPTYKTVDTCAAEFASYTPYLYSTYEITSSEAPPTKKKKVIILGGGPNRIGQGLEFDYCCVHAALALKEAGFETIMINCNPETVSTDYDTSDRLYFEPLTLEDVLEIIERERPQGVIVQYGGQTPLRLAESLEKAGVPIVGTSPASIDLTEDREKFRQVLLELDLHQAESGTARNEAEALQVSQSIGFPLLVRPSFVLGGRAMAVVHNEEELRKYIRESVAVSFDRPVLLDRFLIDAVEVDVDAVCDGEEVLIGGIMEHIERAGIHSGDSSFLLPAQTLTSDILEKIEQATKTLAYRCGVLGLMNVQFAITTDKEVYVIEVNPRASRSVPFVSKVTGIPWAKVAACVMLGEKLKALHHQKVFGDLLSFRNYQEAISRIPYVAVKESVFPFIKFRGSDTLLGPEMRSTGEVMGIDKTATGAFFKAQVAAGNALPLAGTVFLSLRDSDKPLGITMAKKLTELGYSLLATEGTASIMQSHGIPVEKINKVREGSPHVVDALREGKVKMVINTPEGSGPFLDSRSIRMTAIELGLPLFTTAAGGMYAAEALAELRKNKELDICSIQEYLGQIKERSF